MINWMSGGTMRRKRALRSRLSCWNSFSTRLTIRPHIASPQRLAERTRREQPDDRRVKGKQRDWRDQIAEPAPFQEDRLQDRKIIPRGDQIGDRLDGRRHLLDRESEAGEQRRRQKRHDEGDLARAEERRVGKECRSRWSP